MVLILLELTFLRFVETYFKFFITHHALLKIVLVEGNGGDSSGSETTDMPKNFLINTMKKLLNVLLIASEVSKLTRRNTRVFFTL